MSELDHLAVIGLAGRFPGAADPSRLWRNLVAGVESITHFTDEELRRAGVADHLLENPRYVKARGVVEHADRFDADLFGMPPSEAELLDPQHRVLLECAWNALEDAGYAPAVAGGPRIGVFAGSVLSTYLLYHLLPRAGRGDDLADWRMVMGNDKDTLSPRISYKLGLKGPSVTVQTACSTSLVAVHLAAQSLLSFECDLALAGGVSVRCPLVAGYLYHEDGIASPDGRCRPFDARAAGTVFGSGAGLVVLKRLEDALADGDPIRAVVRGSAINNDGADKIGFTAPGTHGQTEVIVRALAMAEVEPSTVSYVEAHGTATPLGDPIEVEALTRAFRTGTQDTGFCALGSVKSNIGHLDGAAGIAGLIKTILALEHQTIPASLHFEQPNPRIDFGSSPFFVAAETRPWPAGSIPRRAGVSSFGIGGTNAHVVLEEAATRREPPTARRSAELLVISARTRAALERSVAQLRERLEAEQLPAADVAYTLAVGRHPFRHRLARVCRGSETPAAALTSGRGRSEPAETADAPPSVCFLFPGQGAQRPGMGRELYDSQPVFRRELDRAAEILRPRLGRDLLALLFASGDDASAAGRELHETRFAQPALFALEAALARAWMAWGVQPQAMLGHSLGEYVAAHLAGVFDLEAGLGLVTDRAELMQQAPRGAMLAVRWGEDRLAEVLEDLPAVALAALGAGLREDCERLLDGFEAGGRRIVSFKVSPDSGTKRRLASPESTSGTPACCITSTTTGSRRAPARGRRRPSRRRPSRRRRL